MKNKSLYLYIYKYFMASKMWVVALVVEFSASEAEKQRSVVRVPPAAVFDVRLDD